MSTLEATMSMLEAMPEEARQKVLEFTQQLFSASRPANPFAPLSEERLLSDLDEARRQIENGQGLNMQDALQEMGKRHGFV